MEPVNRRWLAFFKIPFKSLGVESPEKGGLWRGNFGRTHLMVAGQTEHALWSANPETRNVLDKGAFGEIAFGAEAAKSTVEAAQERQQQRRFMLYEKSFEIPTEWRDLPETLPDPWGNWVFQVDPADRGVNEQWFAPDFDAAEWLPMEVPAFWRETSAADYLGYGWYRVEFKLPESWKGRGIRLLFGSVDGQAWVYVNGKLVRERSDESERARVDELWEMPFSAEVPAVILHVGDQPNILALRVHKLRGNAGIWRPVLLQAVP